MGRITTKGENMKSVVIAFAVVALSTASAFAGGKGTLGGSFDATATGSFSAAGKLGNAKAKSSNENGASSKSKNNNGKVSTKQNTGSVSYSGTSAKNGGVAGAASGGFGAAVGGAGSLK